MYAFQVAFDDTASEFEDVEPEEITSNFITQDQDVTHCLASVIADAIRDGYDLRSEHAGEFVMFNLSQDQESSTTDAV